VQARYLTDLRMRYMTACHVIADRALARLTPPQREAVRSAFADAKQHFEGVCRDQDELLLGGLFARQGLQTVPVDPAFRAEFEVAAVAGRKRLGELGLSAALIDRVLAIIAELRARSSRALAH